MRVNVDRRASNSAEARAWTIAEGVVGMLVLASLIGTALHFTGRDWLAQQLNDVRSLQHVVLALGPR